MNGTVNPTPDWPMIEQHRRRFATEYDRGVEPRLHPDNCGPCEDCAAFIAERRCPGTTSAPTLHEFIRHAHLFGPECVIEAARGYVTPHELAVLETDLAMVDSKGYKPAKKTRQRRTTSTLREQVLDLDRRGLVRAAIADTLNVSDRRVAEILNKSETSRNGGRKRPVQAKLFAA